MFHIFFQTFFQAHNARHGLLRFTQHLFSLSFDNFLYWEISKLLLYLQLVHYIDQSKLLSLTFNQNLANMYKQTILLNSKKPQPTKLPKKLPIYHKKREQLVLLSPSSFKKFSVYSDIEIGINKNIQNTIIESTGDEDYESSEEIIEMGLKKCLKILEKQLSISHSQRETDSEVSKESKNSCETNLNEQPKIKQLK